MAQTLKAGLTTARTSRPRECLGSPNVTRTLSVQCWRQLFLFVSKDYWDFAELCWVCRRLSLPQEFIHESRKEMPGLVIFTRSGASMARLVKATETGLSLQGHWALEVSAANGDNSQRWAQANIHAIILLNPLWLEGGGNLRSIKSITSLCK